MCDGDKLLKVITILSLFLQNLSQFEESAKKKTLSFVEVTVTRQNTLFDSKSALIGQKPIVHCTGKSTENWGLFRNVTLDRTFYQKGCLTNRFKVAVCLFRNRSQMTSKCGKNKKVAHEAQPSVTDVLTTFWRPLWSVIEQTHGNLESICSI